MVCGGWFLKSVVRLLVTEERRVRICGGRLSEGAEVGGGVFSLLFMDWAEVWLEVDCSWVGCELAGAGAGVCWSCGGIEKSSRTILAY
jgi:hypothetical protein